jgi:hypothetical protein
LGKIKRFELTPDVWSIEGGQLDTYTKTKRKIVMEKYIIYSIKSTINVILSIITITNKYVTMKLKILFYSLLSILLFSNCQERRKILLKQII